MLNSTGSIGVTSSQVKFLSRLNGSTALGEIKGLVRLETFSVDWVIEKDIVSTDMEDHPSSFLEKSPFTKRGENRDVIICLVNIHSQLFYWLRR